MNDAVNNLNAFRYNVKAETVISNLLISGYSLDNIIIEFKSSHKKNWDHDILSFERSGNNILIKLSRDGIVHSLPEYLFLSKVEGNIEEKEEIRKFNKKQELNAKMLFNPVESRIFQSRVDIETWENEILASLNSNENTNILAFWKVNESIDNGYKKRLMRVLPFLHSIVGDFNLTAKCLEFFLDSHVKWSILETNQPIHLSPATDLEDNNSYSCGDSMITCGDFSEFTKTIVFTIGPIPGAEIASYLKNGKKGMLFNNFINYFIPLEYDTDFVVEIDKSDSGFSLNDSYLGLNTTFNL